MSNQWEPIETAPKDGSFVLVGEWFFDGFNPEFDGLFENVFFIYSVAYFQTDKPKGKKGKWYDSSSDEILNPSHWISLPVPYPLVIDGKQNG